MSEWLVRLTSWPLDADEARVRSSLPDAEHPVAPFLAIVALAFLATVLRTAGTNWSLVAVAASVAAAAALIGLLLPWSRLSPAALLLLPFAFDGILALLRHAQGGSTSGYSPLAILPVAWVGLTQGRRAVAAMTGCTALLFAVPLVFVGGPLYPATGWRGVILLTAVALVVGLGANRVVDMQRRLTVEASSRAEGLDQMIRTQTEVASSNLGIDDVMTRVAQGALDLTGADAACIELVDGDEVVCTAGAGKAVDFIGLRLRAAESITGECFRTGQILTCSDSEEDTRVAREACRLVGARSLIVVPLLHGGQAQGVLIVWSAEALDFGGYETQLLGLLANTIGAALVRAELITKLTAHAITDELTGLPNRRAWYERLDEAMARASRRNQPLSILILDLDGLKQVNDLYGHAAGDRLLKSMSSTWAAQLRITDLLGRLGGDEFAAILELTDEPTALEVMSRLDGALDGPHRASMGLAVWDGSEDPTSFVARADAQMYARKRARGTVEIGTA
jgi:diguanylate cyclase (GGDEF)-like protein